MTKQLCMLDLTNDGWMNGWKWMDVDGLMDGWMDECGWMDRLMDGWMDVWM